MNNVDFQPSDQCGRLERINTNMRLFYVPSVNSYKIRYFFDVFIIK